MSHFLRSGNTWKVADDRAVEVSDRLPPGNYVVKQDPFGNLFLEEIEKFEFRGKKYGDNDKNRDRIFSTFMSRNVSTGVMLTGEKGSGKTLLAKTLTMKCHEEGIPCIVINTPWRGDDFNKLLQDISQPCMVLFDEFEKVYDSEQQEDMLTLLDGVFPSKKLFVLTCNDKWRVDRHMRNRPGRIFYMLDFKGLSPEFIEEYCWDNLKNTDNIQSVVNVGAMFTEFNFDMLKALVEEMNRYNETAQESMRMLNARPEFDDGGSYDVFLTPVGQHTPLDKNMLDEDCYKGNPLTSHQITLGYKLIDKDEETGDEDWEWESLRFSQANLKHLDAKRGEFTFINDDGDKLVLTRQKVKNYSYWGAF